MGTHAYACRNLETGEEAVVVSTPRKIPYGWRWDFTTGELVELPPDRQPQVPGWFAALLRRRI